MNASGDLWREVSWRGSHRADVISSNVLGLGFLAAASAFAVRAPRLHGSDLVHLILLIALYVIADHTVFRHPTFDTVPTEPILVAMLFLVPLPVVPVAVGLARVLSDPPRVAGIKHAAEKILTGLGQCWYCIGPVLVLIMLAPEGMSLVQWPVLVIALVAQTVTDSAATLFRQFAMGRNWNGLLLSILWTLGVDAALAILGLCAVIAGRGSLWSVLFAAVPVGVVALLAIGRKQLAETGEQLVEEVVTAQEEARIDPLTGLGNRRAWYQAVDVAQDSLRDGRLVAGVLAADLNGLKRANDRYGHSYGDRLIQQMADLLVSQAPSDAVICRMGGDEFALLQVRPLDELQLYLLAERLRFALVAAGPGTGLSAAIGIAACPPEPDLNAALRRADAAAYAEKRAAGVSRRT